MTDTRTLYQQCLIDYQTRLSQFDSAPSDCIGAAILELEAARIRLDSAVRGAREVEKCVN